MKAMLVLDCIAHASEVNGYVPMDKNKLVRASLFRRAKYFYLRCIGDQLAVGAEDGTGKVQPFLDVERQACLLESPAHLLGDAHKPVAKNAEFNGIHDQLMFYLILLLIFARNVNDYVGIQDAGLGSGNNHDGLRAVDNDGWAVYNTPGDENAQPEHLGWLQSSI